MIQKEAAVKRWADPEYRAKQAEARIRSREQKSESLKKKWQDPEFRAKQAVASIERAEKLKELRATPEFKEKMRASFRDEEYRKQLSERCARRNREKWQDPEYRAKQLERMSEQAKERWQNPEYRAKHPGANRGEANPAFIHGESSDLNRTVEFTAYAAAGGRCNNQNHKKWKDYGGRGIKFLFNSFPEFLAEVGRRPSPQHSLDRYPNNNGDYAPGNVRWATQIEQTNNRRPSTEWQKNCQMCGEPLICLHCREAIGAREDDCVYADA